MPNPLQTAADEAREALDEYSRCLSGDCEGVCMALHGPAIHATCRELLAAVDERLADDKLRFICAIYRNSVREGEYIEWRLVEPRGPSWYKVTRSSPFGAPGEPFDSAVAALAWVRQQEAK